MLKKTKSDKVLGKKKVTPLFSFQNFSALWVMLLMVGSFFLGHLYTKVQYLEGKIPGGSKGVAGVKTPTPSPSENLPQDSGPVNVSLDDDPVLGSKNAKVTLVEFSDYECPVCKRHYEQTYPELKKDYIDTGKVKLVFRDFPISYHDPMATAEALAANCARDQGGDSSYYKYHNELFTRTKSGGNGLTKDDLYKIASDLGFNLTTFKSCLDSEKYKDEVKKDLADAQKVGVSGTPTFFIGKTNDSQFVGEKIVGAQPYSVFKSKIDELLK